jgi:pimeloyl-ACP methyl ester carboxylesterase
VPAATDTLTVRSGEVSLSVRRAGDPAAPTVLMLHGYPDTQGVWVPVAQRLAARFEVVTYDVRGAGDSSAPRGAAAYHLDRLAEDFDAVCRAVAAPGPARPVHLVGHDWGGIQGWDFVTRPRLAGRVASFTSIAGPALGHAVSATRTAARRRNPLRAIGRVRRSWYIVPLCLPGGPTVMWKVLLGGDRWRRWLTTVEGLELDDDYPAATTSSDGWHGAKLYRANIPHRLIHSNALAPAHAPVQLIIPTHDRFISPSYYKAAARVAPGLRRHEVSGTHWLPRAEPDIIAARVAEFVDETEAAASKPASETG